MIIMAGVFTSNSSRKQFTVRQPLTYCSMLAHGISFILKTIEQIY